MAIYDIRSYLHQLKNLKEFSSYYQSICPVCHKDKLKINKTSGAFACYGRHCSFTSIVKKLDPTYVVDISTLKKTEPIEPLYVMGGTLSKIDNIPSLDSSLYVYSPQHKKIKLSKGNFYYQTLVENPNPTWINSKFDCWYPYIPIYPDHITEGDVFICVEGEKDVQTLIKLGYVAFTFATIQTKEVDYGIAYLKSNYNFSGVLVFNDADSTGLAKQKKVLSRLHYHKVPASPVRIENLYMSKTNSIPPLGYDISDYVQEFNITQLCLNELME